MVTISLFVTWWFVTVTKGAVSHIRVSFPLPPKLFPFDAAQSRACRASPSLCTVATYGGTGAVLLTPLLRQAHREPRWCILPQARAAECRRRYPTLPMFLAGRLPAGTCSAAYVTAASSHVSCWRVSFVARIINWCQRPGSHKREAIGVCEY